MTWSGWHLDGIFVLAVVSQAYDGIYVDRREGMPLLAAAYGQNQES